MTPKVVPEGPRWTPESLKIPQKVVPESALAPKGAPKGPKELKINKKVPQNHKKSNKTLKKYFQHHTTYCLEMNRKIIHIT